MTRADKVWLVLLGLGTTGITALMASVVWVATRPDVERLYDTKFGRVLCMKERYGECGVTLSNCHDGRVYVCLTDVRRDQE